MDTYSLQSSYTLPPLKVPKAMSRALWEVSSQVPATPYRLASHGKSRGAIWPKDPAQGHKDPKGQRDASLEERQSLYINDFKHKSPISEKPRRNSVSRKPQRHLGNNLLNNAIQDLHAQHVHGIDNTSRHHTSQLRRANHLTETTSQACSTQSIRQKNNRKSSVILSDLHSLPEIKTETQFNQSDDQRKSYSKSRRHFIQTLPSSGKAVKHTPLGTSIETDNKAEQMKHFVQSFNKKDSKSLTSNNSKGQSRDLPSMAAASMASSVPRWFLGSVARSEHLDVARSYDSLPEENPNENFDPDFEHITDAQEFNESYYIKHKEGHEVQQSSISDPDVPTTHVWRTLPMQGELEKYLHYMQSGKGLNQKFTKYVGAQIPGKYRSGGPITRPRVNQEPLMQKARYPVQIQAARSQENSALSVPKEQQEMNRMHSKMATLL